MKFDQIHVSPSNSHSLSQWTLKKKSLNFIFPIKYVIPKSLRFSHWPSKLKDESKFTNAEKNFPNLPSTLSRVKFMVGDVVHRVVFSPKPYN